MPYDPYHMLPHATARYRMADATTPEYTDLHGAAQFLSLSPLTLQSWRSRGKGPPFIRVGSSIRYSYADLREWMAQRREHP